MADEKKKTFSRNGGRKTGPNINSLLSDYRKVKNAADDHVFADPNCRRLQEMMLKRPTEFYKTLNNLETEHRRVVENWKRDQKRAAEAKAEAKEPAPVPDKAVPPEPVEVRVEELIDRLLAEIAAEMPAPLPR